MIFFSAFQRELLLAVRRPADLLNPLFFFVMVVALFPLGIGPGAETLQTIAPGVIWVAALLATLMGMDMLFRGDFEDGSLDQIAMSRYPLVTIVGGKLLGQWCLTGLVLALISPVIGLMYQLDGGAVGTLVLSLLLGTPTLTLVGAIGAALTVSLKKGGVLVAVLVLPLYVPVLILGTAMVAAGVHGEPVTGHALWLGAMLLLAVALAPLATAAALRVGLG